MGTKQSDAGPASQGKALWMDTAVPLLAVHAGRLTYGVSGHVLCRMASLAVLVSSLKLADQCPDYEMV